MGGFPALLLLLALPGSCMPGEDTHVFLHVEGDSFRANCSYDVHKHLQPVTIFAKKGKSLFLHCSYSVTANVGKLQHFMWCKMVSRARCQPIIRANADQSIIKVGRTEMMNDFTRKMIRVWLKNLQLNDSGEYHLESHFQGRNKLLKRIMLKVLGENWKLDASPTDASKKDQRTRYTVMVLSSFLATTALIATVTLLVTSYIRRKRAGGKGMDFSRHPDFRKGVLQKDGWMVSSSPTSLCWGAGHLLFSQSSCRKFSGL
uniref:Immunoglobulin V-set domain-containing protein n=1 Tax=Anser cygnoides TaxID=8845 RepID=A0A8B9D6A3_ANSCY